MFETNSIRENRQKELSARYVYKAKQMIMGVLNDEIAVPGRGRLGDGTHRGKKVSFGTLQSMMSNLVLAEDPGYRGNTYVESEHVARQALRELMDQSKIEAIPSEGLSFDETPFGMLCFKPK